jgi:hypothetical protein
MEAAAKRHERHLGTHTTEAASHAILLVQIEHNRDEKLPQKETKWRRRWIHAAFSSTGGAVRS